MGARWEQFECGLALLKINWGIGMMAMAYYISLLGAPCGVAFFVFTMLITYLGVDRLLRAEDALDGDGDDGAPDAALLPAEKRGRDATYTSVCRGALGPRYETLACALIWLCSVSSCVAYATFVADNGARFAGGPRWAWAAALGGCALPGALFLGDRLDSLRWCNAAGLGLGVLFSGLGHEPRGRRAVVAKTLVAFTVFYMAVGLSGAALYADLVPTSVIVFFLAFETAEGWCARRSGRDARASLPRNRVLAGRVATVVACAVAGAAVPRFGDFLALTGSVSNAATIYVLPHLMFFRCVPDAPRGEKALSCANVVFGVVSGVVGTVQSARGLFA
ncbi:metalloendopeptidase [Aureococcus anophagefferens]|nr:metalloendopeptidase [Aureococcus anophagefferens]